MIYFTLRGGLGNMLFQIASVTSIALSKKTKASFGSVESHLKYLNNENHFNPKLNYSDEYKNLNMFKNMVTEKAPLGVKVYSYPFHYLDINTPQEDVILDGFFQSEKYFVSHKKEIEELFKPTEEILNVIKNKYSKLLTGDTISLHVRRGDYVNNSHNHPPCSLSYYKKALNILGEGVVLVFSDDIQWCKDNFIGDRFIFIENEKDYVEMYLMSMCKNNIISNSSFSWWGAWLNKNLDKKVVGPKKWFGPSINHNTSDIIPEDWIKI